MKADFGPGDINLGGINIQMVFKALGLDDITHWLRGVDGEVKASQY